MRLKKWNTYLVLLASVIILCLLYQSVWIFSRTTTATVRESYQYTMKRHGTINSLYATYTVGNNEYDGTYLRNGLADSTLLFEVRYLLFAPGISRSNTFISNWGTLIAVFVFLSLISSIVFLRKDIISDQAVFIFQKQRPFIKVEHNNMPDYDVHIVDRGETSKSELTLKEKLKTEQSIIPEEGVKASVYKFNPNAIAIFVVYMIFFFWFFYSLLGSSFGTGEIILYGAILLFVPLFVQNTNNETFRAKILDGDKLTFLPTGIQFEDSFYEVADIDAAILYLESFDGFEYRDQTTFGKSSTVSSGDNNKISFRHESDVIDLTFYLACYKDYFGLMNLMQGWSSKGVKVLLKKVFEDDFIIQEMVHFGNSDA